MAKDKASQILIVEDDVDLAEMLNAYFRVQGYEILTASWGEDAVRIAHEILPDLVLLDIRLPDIDGYEVCRQLRSHRRTQEIPIIFLTEKRDRSDKIAGLELGAVDYITKPFDIQELRLRVRNTLRRSTQTPQANAVTGLPERLLVDERLQALLDQPNWAAIVISLDGLPQFRERYGFVAADDVLRAVSLMLTNAIQRGRDKQPFLGHLDNNDFVIVASSAEADALCAKVLARLAPSIHYFYPIRDRERAASKDPAINLIRLASGVIKAGSDSYETVDDLKIALLRSRQTL